MTRTAPSNRGRGLICAAALGWIATAGAITPQFERIAATGDPVPGRESLNVVFNGRAFQVNDTPGVLSRPTINEAGEVAFYARSSAPNDFNLNAALGLYVKRPGEPLARIVDSTQVVDVGGGEMLQFTNFDPPVLNDNGDLVFYATFSGGSGFFATTTTGGPIVKIVSHASEVPGWAGQLFNRGFKFSGTFARFTLISLNNAGQVVFMGGFRRPSASFDDFGLFGSTVAGGGLVRLVDTTGTITPTPTGSSPFRTLSQSEQPALNDDGIVVFEGGTGPTPAFNFPGIFAVPVDGSAVPKTLADQGDAVTFTNGTSGNLANFFTGHDVNDAGQWIAQHAFGNAANSPTAILTGDTAGTGFSVVADSTSGTAVPDRASATLTQIFFGPLNAAGQVAFHARDTGAAVANSSGAYLGDVAANPLAMFANNEHVPPGLNSPARFSLFFDPSQTRIDLNDGGNAVMEAPTLNEAETDSAFGLYFYEACSGTLHRIVDATTTGLPLPDGLGDTIAAPGCAGSPCERAITVHRSFDTRNGHYQSINNNNDVAFLAAFSTFEVAIYVAHIDAGGGDVTIECPADVTLECPADTDPANTGEATADGCGTINVSYVDEVTPGCGDAYTITRTWSADNGSGTPVTCVQTITVEDRSAPTLTCPAAQTVECNADTNADDFAAWLASATASDTCGAVTIGTDVTELPAGCGETLVTFTATDACGNTAECTATFTVADMTPPTLSCPADLTVPCDGAGNTTELDAWLAGATASDACGEVTLTHDFSGLTASCGQAGAATVTWTATDPCGNSSTCSATFTIEDAAAPTLTCPADQTVECDGAGNVAELDAWLNSAAANDGCGGAIVTHDFTGLTPSCGQGGAALVTWTAVDDCGNETTCSATFVIDDTTPPALTAPADLVIGIDAGVCTASNVELGTPTAADACGEVSLSNDAPATFPLGSTVVTWTAVDACGNETTATQTVTVENLAPTAVVNITQLTDIGDTAAVRFDGSSSTDPEDANSALEFKWIVDGFTECDGVGASCEVLDLDLVYGLHTVTLRVTDRCGSYSEVTTEVMVDPAELSVLELNRSVVIFCLNPARATIRGRIGLPLGVDYSELAAIATTSLSIGGVEVLAPTSVNFTTLGAQGRHWRHVASPSALGVQRFNISWAGNSYQYRSSSFPIELRSDVITTTETLLEVTARRRNLIPGPFTLSINGGAALVSFDEEFNVVSANVPVDVEVVRKRLQLTLPFPLTGASTIEFGGSLPNTIQVLDGLTPSLGRFTATVRFDPNLLPDGEDTLPQQIEFNVAVGGPGYPGSAIVGDDEIIADWCHWRMWDCEDGDDDAD